MKKNLFLLFSLYFFVVQSIVIGILRGESNFYILAAINLVCIILVAAGERAFGKAEKSEPSNETKRNEFVEHKHPHTNGQQSLSNKTRNFILSIVIAIIIYLQSFQSRESYAVVLISVLVGFIIFLLLNAIFKSKSTKKQSRMSAFYLTLLVISLGLWIYGYIDNNKDTEPKNNDKIVASGTVLESGMNAVDKLINSGTTTTDTVLESNLSGKDTNTAPTTTTTPKVGESLKIIDALKYLFDKYNLTPSTKTDVTFTYVSKDSAIYPIYRAAYERRLIGKNTNPTKMILCDSYIVMKGLLEKWDVTYNTTNVTTQFRNEAIAKGELNGCQKGKTVKESNL